MKGSLLWKLMYVFCALAGILAGYGVFSLAAGTKPNRITEDNTLVLENGNGVFFDAENSVLEQPEEVEEFGSNRMNLSPTAVPSPTVTEVPVMPPEEPAAEPVEVLPELPEITMVPEETVSAGQAAVTVQEDLLPSLGSQWVHGGITVVPQQEAEESPVEEVITYPAKIFGQTPILNRSDAYVSYFEFCYDLISIMEPEVRARGLNMNALMTKFALKALFCGVDIEQLDINAPIPRRLAALCLWLAAQVLGESGCDTSSKSAEQYVTDIPACSSSERKAIAYLYERKIIKGYQTAGQKFYPNEGLKTEAGKAWLSGIKQCWK